MTKLKYLLIIGLAFLLYSCGGSNDKIYANFKNDFKDSIRKDQAEEFDFTYDILNPQKSYFVDEKLKYLILEHSGELCDSETMYIFSLKNDSLIFKIDRSCCYKDHERWHMESDSIYVNDKPFSNNLSNKVFMQIKKTGSNFQHDDWLYEVKKNTEKAYRLR